MEKEDDCYISYGGDKIIRSTFDLNADIKGLGYKLFNSMKKHRKKIIQIVAATGETATYDELLKRCIRTALQMKKLGIEKDDVVCVCTHDDHLNSSVPLIASAFIGAIATCLEPDFSLADTTHLLKVVPPKIIFVVPEALKLIENAVEAASLSPTIVVFGDTNRHTEFSEFVKENPEENSFQPFVVEDIAATATICFSSGITGLPKGICLKHYRYLVQAARDQIGQSAVPDGFQRNNIIQNVIIMGGRVQKAALLKLKAIMPNAHICPRYGLTESGQLLGFNPKSPKDQQLFQSKLDSCGRPVKGVACKIVDVETEETLGFNQKGELKVLTKSVMNGYYNMDSSSSFDASGWLKTGDVVYYNEDFYFYVVDRLRDVLIYQAIHVPPAAVEQVLLTHPAVKEAVVFGIPHEIDGDLPTALVVLKDGIGADAAEIRKFADDRTDEYKRLRGGLKIVDRLYYTPTKKFKRSYMKQLYLEGNL